MFPGSMDFMRFEYLADKFENIIGSAAEAFAFDIAMSVLSEKVSATMKSIMAGVDRLNRLQLDDCRKGKALLVLRVT